MSSTDPSNIGKYVDFVSVNISYDIINLFSGQLYSSPTKAIEELVVNSYDAFANVCYVYIPKDWDKPSEKIIVFDDGDAMDENGLKELWLIAATKKRDKDREDEAIRRGRRPIGKFGIGKLASYVIGERISHICKYEKKYLGVTMDYSCLGGKTSSEGVTLPIREIRLDELKDLFDKVFPTDFPIPLLDADFKGNWTIVIIDRLKPRVNKIKEGRLNWVISTALPLDPTFEVYINNNKIESSKLDYPKYKEWIIGENDAVSEKLKFTNFKDDTLDPPFNIGVEIPDIGRVSGKIELYQPTITGGKSEDVGRNNGFFIVVRKRLINIDDKSFGLPEFSHQTFNRFRGVVYADGLDAFLVADREDIQEEAKALLNEYLKQKFYEARNYYETLQEQEQDIYPESLESLPGDLIKYPLTRALERSDEENISPWLIRRPEDKKEEINIIKEVELDILDPSDPVGILETKTGMIKANSLHPFKSNFPKDESFKNWAVIEAMTEAYLLDTGLSFENVRTIMEKRDRLMRFLVRYTPKTAIMIAQNILDTTANEKAFEVACERSFRSLGMDVTRLGKSGNPDGICSAPLGTGVKKDQKSYTFVYDAKTSIHEKVKTSDLNLSSIIRHKSLYNADYAVIIAPDYQGEGEDSAAKIEAELQQVTLIRALDLARLIEASSIKPLSLAKLKLLFETCRSPDQSRDWIQEFIDEEIPTPPIREILDTIWELQRENPKEAPSLGAIKWKNPGKFKELTEDDIKDWLNSIKKLVPELINVSTYRLELNQSPDITCMQIRLALDNLREKSMGEALREQI